MIHELRIYYCAPGRLPALLKRFEETTLQIWERIGIRQKGFWTVAIGDNSSAVYYLLEWESLAELETKRAIFASDPEWIEKRAASEKDGPILTHVQNIILSPTAFSAM
ncbi:NIPSNAP family protein [Mesorhizobium sp.]|uniref:NIPSNAP family protein n=1 Tax=Mesorhizobium sp. TaxID=1871066 RepID=UPI000FE6451A|nr:NIPSNAP family protein [Mesorhizobium sp.]RWB69909.1 MAG: NIPSNAP family protein [Mesorhizobium sp.]